MSPVLGMSAYVMRLRIACRVRRRVILFHCVCHIDLHQLHRRSTTRPPERLRKGEPPHGDRILTGLVSRQSQPTRDTVRVWSTSNDVTDGSFQAVSHSENERTSARSFDRETSKLYRRGQVGLAPPIRPGHRDGTDFQNVTGTILTSYWRVRLSRPRLSE